MPSINMNIVNQHEQMCKFSCIPSAVELVLKLLGRVKEDYYNLQDEWGNKKDGGFCDFHEKTIEGVYFTQHFALPRNAQFPLKELFQMIDGELSQGRYVIVSLAPKNGWHMSVIFDKEETGEYIAITKHYEQTIHVKNIQQLIVRMQGTDILVYGDSRPTSG